MNTQRLLDRFLRYVAIDTTANDASASYPSSEGQWELGRLLVDELRAAGLDAQQDRHALVYATLPATVPHAAPGIVLNAHLDTSPETRGHGIRPQVVPHYGGGDIVLPGDSRQVIRVADNPELSSLTGQTLITTDGTTLLGADDKAGVAVIVETATWLMEHPELPRGPVRLLFTCDEEIGRGVDHVDVARLSAAAAYTLDGRGANEIDVETFSADLAKITVHGVNIHPSIAAGRMVNALRVAADFLARLPRHADSPESTSDRAGFLHPYQISGGVAEVSLRVLLRDFDNRALAARGETVRQAATRTAMEFPGSSIDVEIVPQYRNMAGGLQREPRAVALAEQALRNLGRHAHRTIVRGGTDGSRLTELGLPTPNLSTGQHNPHSPLEWACLEEMAQAAEMLVELVRLWSQQRSGPPAD